MAVVEVASVVPVGREELFAWHASPEALGRIMAHRPGFRLVSHEGHIRPGARVVVEDRVFGVPVRMAFRHAVYDPPRLFAEEMVEGPFSHFLHEHLFEEAEGGTRMTDRIAFSLPWWFGGEVACALVAAPMLRARFRSRHAELPALAASGGPGA